MTDHLGNQISNRVLFDDFLTRAQQLSPLLNLVLTGTNKRRW